MKTFWTKTTTTALLIALVILLSAAFLIHSKSDAASSAQTYALSQDDDALFAEFENGSSADMSEQIARYGASSAGRTQSSSMLTKPMDGAPPKVDITHEARRQDLISANGLVAEMRRIIRSGHSMDALRNSANNTLSRRCVDGMQKLQADVVEIRNRRKNIALPSSSASMGKVFYNLMKCVSCDRGASNYCTLAEKDLVEITRSLSIK